MKAIIPVAGAGIRLRPLTYTQPKPLIPVAGKPILAYIVDQLLDLGIHDFVFVIGYLGEKIINYIQAAYPNIKATFITQEQRLGLGHAIYACKKEFKSDDDVVILLGDTILEFNRDLLLNDSNNLLGVKKVGDPREFGVVELDEEGIVLKAIEKPKIPKSNLAMVGIYRIKQIGQLFEALEHNIAYNIKTYNEFQLTDALQRMVDAGVKMKPMQINNWFDCGKREILLITNAKKLDDQGYTSDDLPYYENTIIINPVSIGQDCDIKNSIIGPHVTIGTNVKIDDAIIKDSIIGNFAQISEIVLNHSIIGNDAYIKGLRQSLNIGDNTEIDFS